MQDAIKRKHPSPCKNCTDREVGCHSKCERYAEYKRAIEAESLKVFTSLKEERSLENSDVRSRIRTVKSGKRGTLRKWDAYKKGGAGE
jgi:hypothetical protein